MLRFSATLQTSLREERLLARTIVLKIRYSDFRLTTRSQTLATPFDGAEVIVAQARRLVERTMAGRRKVRLVGVTLAGIIGDGEPFQKPLFPVQEG